MGKIGDFDTDAGALVKRIAAHDMFGENSLNDWIFDTANIEPGMRVLDLGCGTGKQTLDLLERGCTVTALDASQDALEMLKTAAKDKPVTVVQSWLDDVSKNVEGSFDRVISSYAIYYSKEPEALFRTIFEMLNPDGAFFFCGPSSSNNAMIKELLNKIGKEYTAGATPFMENLGPELVEKVFGNVMISDFENALSFHSADALWEYWSSHNMFDSSIEARFREAASEHFNANDAFVNVKRVKGVLGKR